MNEDQSTAPWETPLDVAEEYWGAAGVKLTRLDVAESHALRKLEAVIHDQHHALGQLIDHLKEQARTGVVAPKRRR
jgi:hypothetical protein